MSERQTIAPELPCQPVTGGAPVDRRHRSGLFGLACACAWLAACWLAGGLRAAPWTPTEKLDQPWRLVSLLADGGLAGRNIFNFDFERAPESPRVGTVWIAASDGLHEYDGYDWRRYGKADGLPSDFVRCVLVTRAGQLWVGTDQGAGVFDRHTFRTLGSGTGLAGPNVRRMVEDPDGSIWFCCDSWPQARARGGLTVYRQGRWRSYHSEDGLPGEYVVNYFRDAAGDQFALTLDGLARLAGERWLPEELPPFSRRDLGSACLAESPGAGLVLATGRRVLSRQAGRWVAQPATERHEHGLCVTRDGQILATASVSPGRKAFVEWSGHGWQKVSAEFKAPHNYTEDIREAPDGSVWVAGYDCLIRWTRRGGEWQEYPGLPLPRLVDGAGHVWFARFANQGPLPPGLFRLARQQWENLGLDCVALESGRDGSVWGLSSSQLVHFQNGQTSRFSFPDIGLASVSGVYPDALGHPWVLGQGAKGEALVATLDGQRWQTRPVPGTVGNTWLGLGNPTFGGLWLVKERAEKPGLTIARFGPQTFESFDTSGGILSLFRAGLYADQADTLWAFGDNGLFRWRRDQPGAWIAITNLPGRLVFGCEERGRELWFGCNGTTGGKDGLARLRDGQWTSFQGDTLANLSRAADGSLLLGGSGKFTIVPNVPDPALVEIDLPVDELVNAVVKDPAGNFWCGTGETVFRFRPDELPHRVRINATETNILASGRLRVSAVAIERFLPRGQRNNCRFAWRIDHGPFSEFSRVDTWRLPARDLAIGPHRFEVMAQDAGLRNETDVATLAFHVVPLPIQSRPWFVPLLGVVIVLLAALALQAFGARRQLAGYARGLEGKVAERTVQLQAELQDRQALSEALARQRADLLHIFDAVPAIIFFKDREHRLLRVNAAFAALCDLPKSAIEGHTDRELGQAYATEYYRDDDAVGSTGSAMRGIVEPFETRRGIRWLQTDKFPVLDEAGRITGVVGFAVDITERRRAELERERSDERLQLALNAARMGVWEWDPKTNQVFWSRECYEITGLATTEVTLETFLGLLHPGDAGRVMAALNQAITDYSTYQEEFRLLRPDGAEMWLANLGKVENDANGLPRRLVGVMVDITARKTSEIAPRETQERFTQLAENVNEVFWLVDAARNTMLYVSPGYEKIWGRSCASLYARPQAWLESIHPDDRDRIRQAALARQSTGGYDEEYRINRPDGDVRWIHDRVFPVCDPAGRIYRVAGLAEDVTARRQLEEQFRQAQKMEAIGQLAGGVAHDFNNILTVILGNAALLATPGLEPGETADCAREVIQAAERAAGLTRQLLLFSRKQIMRAANLDLNETVGNMTKMLQRILGEDIALEARYAAGLPAIHADAGMIEQVLLNLAVNARDAMPDGGRLTIATSLEMGAAASPESGGGVPGPWVGLQVIDTGSGIAPEHLPRIFEPFFTTKEVGKGTGLGLATVYGIVKEHHGWITVDSQPGQGATFRLGFPAVVDGAARPADVWERDSQTRGSETILVVEDESSLRSLVVNLLKRRGFTVLAAASGVEALEVWAQNKDTIQLLLTDLVMPLGISGWDLARRLQSERPGLKVIYTSGYSAELTAKGLELVEGVNFIQKPYTPQKVTRLIRECLDRA